MDTLNLLKSEFEQEYKTTKNFIDAFPEGKNDFAPHEKSMKLMPLATHLVEIFAWPSNILKTEVLDFSKGDYKPSFLNTKEELQKKLEDDYKTGKKALDNTTEESLDGRWTMKMGDQVLADFNKYEALRHSLNQTTHHRAQLGVYYRLLGLPVPKSYGPSADQQGF